MAGLPWFELDVDMPDDPKCVQLGARLGNPLAFGYVVRLYAYCYRHALDRFDGVGAVEAIEEAARWRGKRGVLVEAMKTERFLDVDGDRLVVHGVSERLEPHLAKQRRDRERMRDRRSGVARTSSEHSANVAGDNDTDKDKERIRDHDTTQNGTDQPTTVERLRVAVSQRLGVIGLGGGGLPPCSSRRLGEVIRNANAAVKLRGFDAVVEALQAAAEAMAADGRPAETFGAFAYTLAGLARPDAPARSSPANGKGQKPRCFERASSWEGVDPDQAAKDFLSGGKHA